MSKGKTANKLIKIQSKKKERRLNTRFTEEDRARARLPVIFGALRIYKILEARQIREKK